LRRPASDTSMGGAVETPRRLHVLRVIDVPGEQLGGAGRAMAATSALLVDRGHVIDHRFSEDMPTPGPRQCRRLLVPLLLALYVMRLKARGEAPDIVEVHEPLGAPYALVRRLTWRRWLPPMVALSHGLEERGWRAQKARWRLRGWRGPLKSRILVPVTLVAQAKIALGLADAVVVLSNEDRDHLLRKRWMRASRIHRIDNGVEEDLLTLRRPPRAADGSMLLLFVGSWIDRKGTPELTQAFARLCRDHPDARLAVAGTGAPTAEVISGFPASVRGNVEVHQSVTRAELRELLGRADLFVLPSWFEGMPLSLLEAAAAGLPIVASDMCGIRDVLRSGDPDRDAGLLVPPHDGAALHAALDELVRDSALRAELGARARNRGRSFTWVESADALERVYRASVDAG
jgi:glycosyltransferase involved in cell wall biosynthesis